MIKFQNDRNYTEAEKQSIEMTMAAQAGVHSRVIFKEACHRVSRNTNLQHDLEEMEDSQVAQIYYDEVLREALAIVDDEFEFQPNLNIEALAKREAKVKRQIENGDITMEEAQEILRKPIHVKEETKQQEDGQEKGYEQAYEGERQKTERKKKYRGKNKGRNNRNRTNQTQARNGEDEQERSTEERKTGGNRAAEFRRAQTKYTRQPKQPKQTSPRSPEKETQNTQEGREP